MVARWHQFVCDTREVEIGLGVYRLVSFYAPVLTIVLTCHFKHPGLKLGFPSLASLSVVKTCNTFCLLSFVARNGSSFSSYWTSGNLSNTRLSGAGMRKMLLCCCWVHEAAGGPPAFCVMEARDGVSSLGIVVLAPGHQLHQQSLSGVYVALAASV